MIDFYEKTIDYEFEIWSQWCQVFRPFGGLISRLYSRRLQQLNLPLNPLDTAHGLRSQIYKLINPKTNDVKYTIWYRHLKSNEQVIYSGVYSHCKLPNGKTCLKIIFPLPRGNATVIMDICVTKDGAFQLSSKGTRFGDAGFYFLLKDSRDNHWARYIQSFQESITVYVDNEGVMRADHILTLWGVRTLQIHYKISPIIGR